MKNSNLQNAQKKNFFEDRVVMVCAIAVTVFLCFFTVFELLTLKLERNVAETTEKPIEIGDVTLSGGNRSELEGAGIKKEQQISTELLATEDIETEECTEIIETVESTESTQEETEVVEDPFPYYLKINRQQNVVTVYEKDESGEYTVPVKAILCSTGLHNATPKGTFKLSSKYIWRELNGGVYGQYASRITGGVLFHSVPYARKNKATLSVSKYNKLGQQASMGCVRLTVEDAKWIYDNCPSGTYVEVYDSDDPGPLGKPKALKLDADSPNKGWDPTDPDERNPWHAWSDDE